MDGDAHHRNVAGQQHQHEIESAEEKKVILSDDGSSVDFKDSSENMPRTSTRSIIEIFCRKFIL